MELGLLASLANDPGVPYSSSCMQLTADRQLGALPGPKFPMLLKSCAALVQV